MAQKQPTKTTSLKRKKGLIDDLLSEASAVKAQPKTKKVLEKINRQEEAKRELAGLSDAFKKIKVTDQRAKDQYQDALDSEHWVTFCFTNRAQKDEFLRLTKVRALGNKYVDGMKAAEILGITLLTPVPPLRKHKKVEKTLSELAMDMDRL